MGVEIRFTSINKLFSAHIMRKREVVRSWILDSSGKKALSSPNLP
jgi:hypothetical protein